MLIVSVFTNKGSRTLISKLIFIDMKIETESLKSDQCNIETKELYR